MKKIILLISIFLIYAASCSSVYANGYFLHDSFFTEITFNQKTIKIKCTQMSCNSCKKSITRSIKQLNGITKLDINLETKIITVVIDDTKTDEQSVLNAVISAGYDAELINRTQ